MNTPQDWRKLTTRDLIELANRGYEMAKKELKRRGIVK